ncbi:MAG: phosphoglucosamine mutase [Symbiobacteriaceae bacterium]|nr:phosphoglucosamine mutase [Symbiobacteriaceae bacterium]
MANQTVKYFGTDGVRGVANRGLTPELAYKLGRGAVRVLGGSNPREKPCLLIGRDTRISGGMLFSALAAGILSAGGDVMDIGVATTPCVAWLTKEMDVRAGVVISASHNPMPDNGIKFIAHSGYKISDITETQIEALLEELPPVHEWPVGSGVGKLSFAPELQQGYLGHLAALPGCDLTGLKIVLDCANGAAAHCGPELLRQLGGEVIPLHHNPDGLNINVNCGSTHLASLQTRVLATGADLGLALDGDADRCLAVDALGRIVDGDQIMLILALALQEQGVLLANTLVTTVMSNFGFHRAVAELGLQTVITKVGDRYVLEAMQAGGFNLGGEQSGHIICSDYATTGDGLLTGILLANRVRQTGATLAELAGVMQVMPQVLHNVQVQDKEAAFQNADFLAALAAAEADLGNLGRILVRPSGTEPLIRITVEAGSLEEAQRIALELAEKVPTR